MSVVSLPLLFTALPWQNGRISVNLLSGLHNYVHWRLYPGQCSSALWMCCFMMIDDTHVKTRHWIRVSHSYINVATKFDLYLRRPSANFIIWNCPNLCSTVPYTIEEVIRRNTCSVYKMQITLSKRRISFISSYLCGHETNCNSVHPLQSSRDSQCLISLNMAHFQSLIVLIVNSTYGVLKLHIFYFAYGDVVLQWESYTVYIMSYDGITYSWLHFSTLFALWESCLMLKYATFFGPSESIHCWLDAQISMNDTYASKQYLFWC